MHIYIEKTTVLVLHNLLLSANCAGVLNDIFTIRHGINIEITSAFRFLKQEYFKSIYFSFKKLTGAQKFLKQ